MPIRRLVAWAEKLEPHLSLAWCCTRIVDEAGRFPKGPLPIEMLDRESRDLIDESEVTVYIHRD
ncbi:MAG: hypothetical protein M0C28_18355 [Candidatus Moduliflexus flocculans]|nr:hypothetical protein [Candidatus Moduliflexus flocculans]